MKCRNWDCKNEANAGWPCCSMNCGAKHKENIRLAKAYADNDLLPYGESLISEWPPEKLSYYLSRVKKLYPKN